MKPLITLGLAAALAMPAPSLFAADPPAGAGGQTIRTGMRARRSNRRRSPSRGHQS